MHLSIVDFDKKSQIEKYRDAVHRYFFAYFFVNTSIKHTVRVLCVSMLILFKAKKKKMKKRKFDKEAIFCRFIQR